MQNTILNGLKDSELGLISYRNDFSYFWINIYF